MRLTYNLTIWARLYWQIWKNYIIILEFRNWSACSGYSVIFNIKTENHILSSNPALSFSTSYTFWLSPPTSLNSLEPLTLVTFCFSSTLVTRPFRVHLTLICFLFSTSSSGFETRSLFVFLWGKARVRFLSFSFWLGICWSEILFLVLRFGTECRFADLSSVLKGKKIVTIRKKPSLYDIHVFKIKIIHLIQQFMYLNYFLRISLNKKNNKLFTWLYFKNNIQHILLKISIIWGQYNCQISTLS